MLSLLAPRHRRKGGDDTRIMVESTATASSHVHMPACKVLQHASREVCWVFLDHRHMGWSSRAGGAEANSLADHTGIANDDKAGRADVHLVATLVLYKKRKRAISPHQVVYVRRLVSRIHHRA